MAFRNCTLGTDVTLNIEVPTGGQRRAQLPCAVATTGAPEVRPDSIKELQSGIWYVDLTRVHTEQLREALPNIASARGVIFDMRGYPTEAGTFILSYLMKTPEDSTDRWMHTPRITGPFGKVADWQDQTWPVKPAAPYIRGSRVFMTDNRAISYAESFMGYVRDHQLGTIIGGATAGANGNIAQFSVPGRFTITFTGMRVTQHDGHTPYHTVGVAPSIPIEPTLAGIRAGRDEVLERALSIFRIAQ
jgi:C-terminal processing protease CtpA/Prc